MAFRASTAPVWQKTAAAPGQRGRTAAEIHGAVRPHGREAAAVGRELHLARSAAQAAGEVCRPPVRPRRRRASDCCPGQGRGVAQPQDAAGDGRRSGIGVAGRQLKVPPPVIVSPPLPLSARELGVDGGRGAGSHLDGLRPAAQNRSGFENRPSNRPTACRASAARRWAENCRSPQVNVRRIAAEVHDAVCPHGGEAAAVGRELHLARPLPRLRVKSPAPVRPRRRRASDCCP